MAIGLSFHGAHQLDGPLTAVDVWQLLHTNAQEWMNVPRNSKFFTLRDMLDDTDTNTLRVLSDFEAENWRHLCHGAGWTVMGAVGLSWCKDSTFEDVAGFWQQVNPLLLPEEFTLRAAGMLNPKLLPEGQTLLTLADAVQSNTFQIALTIAAQNGDLKVDVPPENLTNAADALRPMLKFVFSKSNQPALEAIANDWQ